MELCSIRVLVSESMLRLELDTHINFDALGIMQSIPREGRMMDFLTQDRYESNKSI